MLIDVSTPIRSGYVSRPGLPPVEIAIRSFFHEAEGEYETTTIFMPAHTATHIDVVFWDKRIAPDRMVGRGRLLDATGIDGDEIRLEDVVNQAEIESGDFVFFRTGWSKFAGTEKYSNHPELTVELAEWLISRRVNMVGIDARGVAKGSRHGEYDRLFAENDIFVIENLVNLSEITVQEFGVYCFPLRLEGIDAIPARVVVEVPS